MWKNIYWTISVKRLMAGINLYETFSLFFFIFLTTICFVGWWVAEIYRIQLIKKLQCLDTQLASRRSDVLNSILKL